MANRDAIEQAGRTVDDAVQEALRKLGMSRAQVDVEVLQEGRTGILGIGHAQSLVRVTPRGGRGGSGGGSGAPALPRIDDYSDLTEIEGGTQPEGASRSGRSGGAKRSSGRRTVVQPTAPESTSSSDSQQNVQPDHRSRSRPPAAAPAAGARRDRGRARQGNRRRGRSRDETRERQPARPPIGPFELLADPDFEPNEDPREFAVEVLTDIAHQLGFDVLVTARDPETPMDGLGHAKAVLDVAPAGEEDLGLLIGRHGAHVAALQYVVNVIVSRALDGNNPVTVDVDGYRRRRETALVEMAQRAATEVREGGEPVTLGVMPAAERRIIHLQLQDDPELMTESQGEGPSRRVRILYRDE
ncbi:MAG: Jag N-terminal domain-containing protein [Chloroflexota bacterium]|nr:Jag N-terminal domain-containing protein [Chloroflexota bacterium]